MQKVFIVAMFFIFLVSALSSEPMVVDLDSCIRMAMENNPDFRVTAINVEMAERNSEYSWNNFLPSIAASGSFSTSTPVFFDDPAISFSASSSLTASLSLNPSLKQTFRDIELSLEDKQISYETARLELKSAVEKEFYYLITSASNLEIEKSNWALAQKSYDQVLSNYENGRASELSVLQAEISAANLEPAYKQAVATHESRVKEFLIVLGLDPDSDIELEGSLEVETCSFDAEEILARSLSDRMDIQSLVKGLEIKRNDRELTKVGNRTPTLSLSTYWTLDIDDWDDSFYLGVSVSVPIEDFLPGSTTSVSLATCDDEIRQGEISLDKALVEARTEVINLLHQLETSEDNMRISALNIELAEKTLEMTEESYSRGLSSLLDVEDSQQEYLSAKQQYLSSQYTYLSGLIDLRDALGLESLEEL